jgi:hypothetical protein
MSTGDGSVYGGRLGQTLRVPTTVTSESGRTFTASVVTQINATTDPSLREALVDGTLTTVSDPHTGRTYHLAVPVLVHDEPLRLFVLVLPDALRHREFACRRELLDAMENSGEPLADYVREFKVAFGGDGLARCVEAARAQVAGDDPEGARMAGKRRELEAWDRKLQQERRSLDALRNSLEALKDELAKKQSAPGAPSAPPRVPRRHDNEPTTVVPRSVFESGAHGAVGQDDGWAIDPAPKAEKTNPEVAARTFSPMPGQPDRVNASELTAATSILRKFDTDRAGSRPWYHGFSGGELVLSYRLPNERMTRFGRAGCKLYLQFHDLEEFPLVTVLVAATGEDREVADDIYWPLDVRRDEDRNVLARLGDAFEVQLALYGEDLILREVVAFSEPLELNAMHLLSVAERRLESTEHLAWEDALRRLEAPDYKRLGDMRHNFGQESFAELSSPAEVRLATGIVGYWSGPDLFRYLIENLSFSLGWFAAIQERVVRAAVTYGLSLSPELTQLALEMQLAESDAALVKALVGTWSELCLGLSTHKNDLDGVEIGLVWQEHIEAAEAAGEALDDDVLTMATGAIRRAQDHQDAEVWSTQGELDDDDVPTIDRSALPESSRRSLLAGLDNEALKARLNDEDDRVIACELLLERRDKDAFEDIMMAADGMSDEELEAISEHLVQAAPDLEDAMIEILALDSATVSYLCGFALASIPSARALPALLELIEDRARAKDPELFAETLIPYGDSLLDELLPRLSKVEDLAADHPLMVVLREYIQVGGEPAIARAKEQAPAAAALL